MTARLALSPDQIEERWPRVRAAVSGPDGTHIVVLGRIVGRTIDGRIDVRADDGTIYINVPPKFVHETF
jgi:hypothetical protein